MSLLPPALPTVSMIASAPTAVLWSEDFDTLDVKRWREVELRRQTRYEIVEHDGQRCLRAQSRDGASILLAAVKFNPERYPWISWRWRIEQPVAQEALDRKDGSDTAARVYVYFDSRGLPWQKRNIDYVWSVRQPVDTILTSAFASTSKIVVADSGMATVGKWRVIERNLSDDYRRIFGEPAPRVVAIGLMTDTDTMGGEAMAYYDALRIGHEPLLTHAMEASP